MACELYPRNRSPAIQLSFGVPAIFAIWRGTVREKWYNAGRWAQAEVAHGGERTHAAQLAALPGGLTF